MGKIAPQSADNAQAHTTFSENLSFCWFGALS
jgi:hypothetical protein